MTDTPDNHPMTVLFDASPLFQQKLTVQIVSAYVGNNAVPREALPDQIASVHTALARLSAKPTAEDKTPVEKPTAAEIRKSITDNGIVSFIDGQPYKTLKRHLTAHGLDPRSYRERYGLPADYPMVAPAYAAQRSDLAKRIGLGRPGAMPESQGDTRGTPDAGPERIAA